MYETLFRPLDYGGVRLKNRVIFAPTTLGLPREAYQRKLAQIAQGGCAMVILGDVPAAQGPRGLLWERALEGYEQLTRIIHRGNCLACAQLYRSDASMKAMLKYLPGLLTGRIKADELRTLRNQQVGPYISGLSAGQLADMAAGFGQAALQARKAGFDMVQVHGDRLCGSLSSSLYNRRSDRYGGSLENRMRFAVEAVAAIRKALPDMPIDFKLAVRQENPHYGNAGLLPEELAQAVPLLERAGVTSFHVTLANHGALEDVIPPANHPCFGGEGCFLPYCGLVRRYTRLPVCGVGGLTSPDYIEAQLAGGRVDCVAMSRQLIADPDWPNKAMEGRAGQIRRCVRCNQCLNGLKKHQGVHCIWEGEENR